MSTLTDQLFLPSGFNDKAQGIDKDFSHYLNVMKDIILRGRCDLTPENRATILQANAPFERRPNEPTQSNGKYAKGILLIHGLFASPAYMMDIGRYFQQQGFLVRSILLPGHGTRPGDLLNIQYSAWRQVTHFAVTQMLQDVDELYLGGMSLGAALSIQQAYQFPAIKGLLLFAPALQPRAWWYNIIKWHPLISWIHPRFPWSNKTAQQSYARYNTWPFNAARQALYLMAENYPQAQSTALSQPLFIVATEDDELVSNPAIISFFMRQPNPNNRLLFFTNNQLSFNDARIHYLPSANLSHRILDLSHQCLTIAPDNPLFGKDSDYQDFNHYRKKLTVPANKIYQGAITAKNLRHYCIQRICYNPHYEKMLSELSNFLNIK